MSLTSLFLTSAGSVLLRPEVLAGALAVSVSCSWPLLRRRQVILAFQAVASLLFGLHYVLLGAPTAAAMCGASMLQGIAAALVRRPTLRLGVFGLTILGGMGLTVMTWAGLPSLCAQTGQLLSAAGRLQRDTQRLRCCFLASEVFWVSHNLMVGSAWGLTSDTLAVTTLLLGLWRGMRSHPLAIPQARTAAA